MSYQKLKKIVSSCETLEQLDNAEILVMKNWAREREKIPLFQPVFNICNNLVESHYKALKQRIRSKRDLIKTKQEIEEQRRFHDENRKQNEWMYYY